ncbi:M18 family aminopeptidase [Actinocrinis puniceicyclus]|uniref:Probable M18 family aminopeptidase 2 n=1 Tax=Actinocrinis puniceicyclus TaxID=977794 RepID=A0A8J7WLZ7_9ACTN|nr:M18 family aminopeptidase [Actinocrinis puniceicyclus]MBS2963260.1 M18 family aminopeptidase [Actinocrinis puniceicyclus]
MAQFDRTHTDNLLTYLAASPTPYHAVAEAAALLDKGGFRQLSETEAWDGQPGGQYVIRGGALVAWYLPTDAEPSRPFRIIGTHTDSPNLRVKPVPDTGALGWRQVAVEVYGGALFNSWLDRDLGLAGRLALRDGSQRLVRVDRPLLRVPQLAIHLDRGVNEGLKLNPQAHLTPVWGLGEPVEGDLIEFLAQEHDLAPEEVLGWDLMVHDVLAPAYLGRDAELVAAARLDNLLSVHAGVGALLAAARSGIGAGPIPMLAAMDHEENGSVSTTGAAGPFLESVLERLVEVRGGGVDARARAYAGSVMASADLAHAVHPNYPERHDSGHRPLANGGPVLKVNANQRYATDGATRAVWARACEAAEVPWQTFVSRNDQPCGSTIGPIASSRLGIATFDIGVAALSMHSVRELCGADDPWRLAAALAAFLRLS